MKPRKKAGPGDLGYELSRSLIPGRNHSNSPEPHIPRTPTVLTLTQQQATPPSGHSCPLCFVPCSPAHFGCSLSPSTSLDLESTARVGRQTSRCAHADTSRQESPRSKPNPGCGRQRKRGVDRTSQEPAFLCFLSIHGTSSVIHTHHALTSAQGRVSDHGPIP